MPLMTEEEEGLQLLDSLEIEVGGKKEEEPNLLDTLVIDPIEEDPLPEDPPLEFPTEHPLVENEDGSHSNVKLGTFESDGKHYIIPTMVEGKQLTGRDPFNLAVANGLENYPSYDSEEEANAVVQKEHGNVAPPEEEVNLLDTLVINPEEKEPINSPERTHIGEKIFKTVNNALMNVGIIDIEDFLPQEAKQSLDELQGPQRKEQQPDESTPAHPWAKLTRIGRTIFKYTNAAAGLKTTAAGIAMGEGMATMIRNEVSGADLNAGPNAPETEVDNSPLGLVEQPSGGFKLQRTSAKEKFQQRHEEFLKKKEGLTLRQEGEAEEMALNPDAQGEAIPTDLLEIIASVGVGFTMPIGGFMASRLGPLLGDVAGLVTINNIEMGIFNAISLARQYASGNDITEDDLINAGYNHVFATGLSVPLGAGFSMLNTRSLAKRSVKMAAKMAEDFPDKPITGMTLMKQARMYLDEGLVEDISEGLDVAHATIRNGLKKKVGADGIALEDMAEGYFGRRTSVPKALHQNDDEVLIGFASEKIITENAADDLMDLRRAFQKGMPPEEIENLTAQRIIRLTEDHPDLTPEQYKVITDQARKEVTELTELYAERNLQQQEKLREMAGEDSGSISQMLKDAFGSPASEEFVEGAIHNPRQEEMLAKLNIWHQAQEGVDVPIYEAIKKTILREHMFVTDLTRIANEGVEISNPSELQLIRDVWGGGVLKKGSRGNVQGVVDKIDTHAQSIQIRGQWYKFNKANAKTFSGLEIGDRIAFTSPPRSASSPTRWVKGKVSSGDGLKEFYNINPDRIPAAVDKWMESVFGDPVVAAATKDMRKPSVSWEVQINTYEKQGPKDMLGDFGKILNDMLEGKNSEIDLLEEATRRHWLAKRVRAEHFENHVVPMAVLHDAGKVTDSQMDRVLEVWGAIDSHTTDVKSHIGRMLNLEKAPIGTSGQPSRALMQKVIKEMKDPVKRANVMKVLSAWDPLNPMSMHNLEKAMHDSSWGDVFEEIWFNNVLSGLATHSRNILGNLSMLGIQETERLVEGVWNSVDFARQGKFIQAGAELRGINPFHTAPIFARAVLQGAKSGWKAFQTEVPSFGSARIVEFGGRESNIGRMPGVTRKLFGFDVGHHVVRVPSRLLLGEDDFFKQIMYSMELNHQVVKKVGKVAQESVEPWTRQNMDDLYKKWLLNPPNDVRALAKEHALVGTFQKKLGNFGQALVKMRNEVPGGRFVVPFLRTPINIADETIQRIPIANFASMAWRYQNKVPMRAGAEVAKTMVGVAVAYGIFSAVDDEGLWGMRLRGGYSDDKSKRAIQETMWQQYSGEILTGAMKGFNISFQNLEPVSGLLGVMTDVKEALDEGRILGPSDFFAVAGMAISSNINNKSFGQGFENMFTMMSPQERDAYIVKRALGAIVTGFVPGSSFVRGLKDVLTWDEGGNLTDPPKYMTRTMGDAMRKTFPGGLAEFLYKSVTGEEMVPLLTYQDMWGKILVKRGFLKPLLEAYAPSIEPGLLTQIFDLMVQPFSTRTIENDAVTKELNRLYNATDEYTQLNAFSAPGMKITIAGQTWEMTRSQFLIYREREGEMKHEFAERLYKSPNYSKKSGKGALVDDIARTKAFSSLGRKTRTQVKYDMWKEKILVMPKENADRLREQGVKDFGIFTVEDVGDEDDKDLTWNRKR